MTHDPASPDPDRGGRAAASELAFHRTLPAKRLAAGLLVRDPQGRVLLVEPTYKPDWEIPGGVVEHDESPRSCARREAQEELGLSIEPGRLLVIDHQPADAARTEAVLLVFDGGTLPVDALARIVLPAHELRSWALVASEDVPQHVAPSLARRLRHALTTGDGTVYLEDGELP